MNSRYEKLENVDCIILNIFPSTKIPVPKGLFIFQGILSLFLIIITQGWILLLWIPLGYLMYRYYYKSKLVTYYRKPTSIKINSETIEVEGRVFKKQDINRILVRNFVDERGTDTSFQSVNASMEIGRMAEGGRMRKLRAVSYYISLEAMGQANTIAGGLQEATAFAILSEIDKARY